MRTVRVSMTVVLVVGLLGGAAVGTAAQDDPPPPWFGARVEMPEYGFAVTVPAGWVAMDPADDVEGQRQVITETWGGRYSDPAATNAFGDIYLLAGPDVEPGYQTCDFTRVPAGTADLLVDFSELTLEQAAAGEEVDREIQDIRSLDLPAAPIAVVVDYVQHEILHFATYVIEREDRAIRLVCLGLGDRPEDDWLSLAESLEFLPVG